MKKPSVSIIMNCLDCEEFLPFALQSLKEQTFQDFEIIFWDNDSRDSSAEIAKDYGPQLKYFKSAHTVPLGAARNLAIARSSGEFIAFLDCDDMWKPEKLALQVELFTKNPAVGLVCTDTEIFNGKKVISRLFSQTMPKRGKVFSELMCRQWISMSSAIVRKSALDAMPEASPGKWFDETLNVCEEADVFYRVAHDWELDYVDRPLTTWRISNANTTFNKFGQFAGETLAILAKHRRIYPDYDRDYEGLVNLLSKRATFQKAVALWKDGQNRKARKTIGPYLGDSLKYRLFWAASFLPASMFGLVAKTYFSLPKNLLK